MGDDGEAGVSIAPPMPSARPVPSASASMRAELDRIAAAASAKIGGENFPVALRVLPRRPRQELRLAYAFARFVDDVGDEAATSADHDRTALLDLVAQDVRLIPAGGATMAPVRGLQPLVARTGLDLEVLLDLIEANRLDQRVHHYETFDDLLGYCRLSAAPIGRIVLAIAGVAGAAEQAASDSVCAALQVLEHCQDVGEDARAGRVYLPARELREAGLDSNDLVAATTAPALRQVVARQVERARRLLDDGPRLVVRLSGWSRVAVAGYVAGGRATAAALRAADYEVLAAQVRPSTFRTAAGALRLVAHRRAG